MPWGFVIGGALGLAGSALGSHAATSAATTQANAANNASATQLQMFEEMQTGLKPYTTAGTTSLGGLQTFMGMNPDGTTNPNAPGLAKFTGADLAKDPGYQFQMQQGTDAIMNQRSAMGGVLSGGTLKDLTSFSQGLAGTTFDDAWKRFMTEQSTQYGNLYNMTSMGESAAAGVGSAGIQTGANIGANTIGAGNATAAGTVGSANAITGGVSNLYSQWLMSQFMNNNNSGGGPG